MLRMAALAVESPVGGEGLRALSAPGGVAATCPGGGGGVLENCASPGGGCACTNLSGDRHAGGDAGGAEAGMRCGVSGTGRLEASAPVGLGSTGGGWVEPAAAKVEATKLLTLGTGVMLCKLSTVFEGVPGGGDCGGCPCPCAAAASAAAAAAATAAAVGLRNASAGAGAAPAAGWAPGSDCIALSIMHGCSCCSALRRETVLSLSWHAAAHKWE